MVVVVDALVAGRLRMAGAGESGVDEGQREAENEGWAEAEHCGCWVEGCGLCSAVECLSR